jgi:hypothetical protein
MCTPEEVSTYLKTRYRPMQDQGKKTKELRWVTSCRTSDPTDDSAPWYADWEACASLYVVMDILNQNDGIRRSGFEGHTVETARVLLVLVFCAL